jgi:hypothetical protein
MTDLPLLPRVSVTPISYPTLIPYPPNIYITTVHRDESTLEELNVGSSAMPTVMDRRFGAVTSGIFTCVTRSASDALLYLNI